MKKLILALSISGLSLFGCGSDGDSSGGGNSAGPAGSISACMSASDCPDGHACIQIGAGPAGCVPTCSGVATECSASAECAGVGSLNVNICQEEEAQVSWEEEEEEPGLMDERCHQQ